jgi:hypothetical protein
VANEDRITGPRRMTREGLGQAMKSVVDDKDRGTLAQIVVVALMLIIFGVTLAATLGLMVRVFLSTSGFAQ